MSQSLSDQIANRIRLLRAGKGWTQQQLAEKANRSLEAISNIERALNSPNLDSLKQIANALGVPLADLLPSEVETDTDKQIAELVQIARQLDPASLRIVLAQVRAFRDAKDTKPD